MKQKAIRARLRKQNPTIAEIIEQRERDLRWEGRKKGCDWSAKWIEDSAKDKSPDIQAFAATVAMSIRASVIGMQPEGS